MNYVKYNGALLEIKAPSGAEGFFTGNISKFKESKHEVTLQLGGVYQIDGIMDHGYYKINLTIIERLYYE